MTIHQNPQNESREVEDIIGIPPRLIAPYTVPALIKHEDFFNRFALLQSPTLEEIANHFQFNPRVLEAILCYLDKEGFVARIREEEIDRFELTPLTKRFLLQDAQYNLSGFALIMNGAVMGRVDEGIANTLRTGKPITWSSDAGSWEKGMRSGVIAKSFSDGMMSRARYLQFGLISVLANILDKHRALLDIGGSSGDYSGKLAEAFPNLECTVYELPGVVHVAEQNIIEHNYQRVNTIAGDMFTDGLPNDYDIHFYSNVIHDWNSAQAKQLFELSYETLPSGGKILIHDLHLDDSRRGSDLAVDFSLYLSVITEGRCYSFEEHGLALEEVGFKDIEAYKTVGGFSVIVGSKP